MLSETLEGGFISWTIGPINHAEIEAIDAYRNLARRPTRRPRGVEHRAVNINQPIYPSLSHGCKRCQPDWLLDM